MSEAIWSGSRVKVLRGKYADEYGKVQETDRYPLEARDEGLVLLDRGGRVWIPFEDLRRAHAGDQ